MTLEVWKGRVQRLLLAARKRKKEEGKEEEKGRGKRCLGRKF